MFHLPDLRLQIVPDLFSALFCLGGERDQDILFFHAETGADEFYLLLDLAALDLVSLGRNQDRLEALGAIGLARVFAVSGALGVALFDGEDPFAQHRPLDDKRYALDHFQTKLLKLPQTMQTARGKQLAQHNAHFLVEFMAKLSAELAGENEGVDHKVIDAFSPAG